MGANPDTNTDANSYRNAIPDPDTNTRSNANNRRRSVGAVPV
jgi:hypothetical protein